MRIAYHLDDTKGCGGWCDKLCEKCRKDLSRKGETFTHQGNIKKMVRQQNKMVITTPKHEASSTNNNYNQKIPSHITPAEQKGLHPQKIMDNLINSVHYKKSVLCDKSLLMRITNHPDIAITSMDKLSIQRQKR